jgi:hypothetical protein
MTISRGALPLALFGAVGYGVRQGWLMAPTRVAQAVAPYAFGLMLERWGAGALWGTTVLSVLAWGALRAVPSPSARQPSSSASSMSTEASEVSEASMTRR